MEKSSIVIDVLLDAHKLPEQIVWKASPDEDAPMQRAKAMCLALWDGAEKNALRIDLWTKDMMVDEMGNFFYQTLMTMADTFTRATRNEDLANDMKLFASAFQKKFQEHLLKG